MSPAGNIYQTVWMNYHAGLGSKLGNCKDYFLKLITPLTPYVSYEILVSMQYPLHHVTYAPTKFELLCPMV